MTELLTIDEINRRYPDEWVLIGDPQLDRFNNIVCGFVDFHGPRRHEMDSVGAKSTRKMIAFHFAGDRLKGRKFLL